MSNSKRNQSAADRLNELMEEAGFLAGAINGSMESLINSGEKANWGDVGSMSQAVEYLAYAAYHLGAIDENKVSEITGKPY